MIDPDADLVEPDLVLTVAAPLPRRGLGPQPRAVPAPWGPPPLPPPVPPPVPPPAPSPAVDATAETPDRARPDRRFWTSTGVSLFVHVVALTIVAFIAVPTAEVRRPRPLDFSQPLEEPDLRPMPDAEQVAEVEMPRPAFEPPVAPPVDDRVELAAFVAGDAAAAADAALAAIDAPFEGVVELDPAGVLARVGGANAGGQEAGFGGEIGRRLARAGAKSGDIQVSLSWENFNDLDLHLIAPSGERIFFAQRRSRCGGILDVDMNAQGPATREPVENVFWPKRGAPPGDYEVQVHHFARHDMADATAFDVHVMIDGTRHRFTGEVKSGDGPVTVARFTKTKAAAAPPADDFVE